MKRLGSYRLVCDGFAIAGTKVGVRVFERQGDYPRHRPVICNNEQKARVVIFTQLAVNRGTSVTQMMHHLIPELFFNQTLMGWDWQANPFGGWSTPHEDLPFKETIFIEHYPPEPDIAEDFNDDDYRDHRFSVVDLGGVTLEQLKNPRVLMETLEWNRVPREQVEAWIGTGWDTLDLIPGERLPGKDDDFLDTGDAAPDAYSLRSQIVLPDGRIQTR